MRHPEAHGCSFYKADLHIHTPASRCYDSRTRKDDLEYFRILDTAIDQGIRILAITDHNTFLGYFRLRQLLEDLKAEDGQAYGRYHRLLILPGVEITIQGTHVLAIFPTSKSKQELDQLLVKIGIRDVDSGDTEQYVSEVTYPRLLSKIQSSGGLPILAHADAAEGLLEQVLTRSRSETAFVGHGKSVADIVKSSDLIGISLNDARSRPKLVNLLKQQAYRRKEGCPAIIQCSDSHSSSPDASPSGKPIGSRYSYVKLSELSWEGLRLALLDPDMRVFDEPPQLDHPCILGVAINGGYLGGPKQTYQSFPLNQSLNCVIGARGTGKSTLLDVIQYSLNEERTHSSIATRFDHAVVYISLGAETYALACTPKYTYESYDGSVIDDHTQRVLYQLVNDRFVRLDGNQKNTILKNVDSAMYRQRNIFGMGNTENGLLQVVDGFLAVEQSDALRQTLRDGKKETERLREAIRNAKAELRTGTCTDQQLSSLAGQFAALRETRTRLSELRQQIVTKMNACLADKVELVLLTRLSSGDYARILGLPEERHRKGHLAYEERLRVAACLRDAAYSGFEWSFPAAILTKDTKSIADAARLSAAAADGLIKLLRPLLLEDLDLLEVFPEDAVEFRYNTRDGSGGTPQFMDREALSMGQKAVAVLLTIMRVGRMMGDRRPLIIDQPEDDLDNMYIYSSLVEEIRLSKNVRQMIFSTHNANIPISGDAEQIIILEQTRRGNHGRLAATGSVDKQKMLGDVQAILEGGSEAFRKRATKYNHRLA